MVDERKGERDDARDSIKDGIKAGLGILGALKEALEETFEQAMTEREFGPDRARDAFKETVRRAQATMEQARDRFDFVSRRDFDALKAQVDALRHQVEHHVTSSVHHTHAAGGAGAAREAGAQVHGELHTHPGAAEPNAHGAGTLADQEGDRSIPAGEGE